MAEQQDERVTVSHVQLDGRGRGKVHLSNGTVLGQVLGIEVRSAAHEVAELVIRVPAVSVQVGQRGEGEGQSLDPDPA